MEPSLIDIAFHAGNLVAILVLVAIVWTKLDGLKEAFQSHVTDDKDRFDKLGKSHHDLRGDLGALTSQVAVLDKLQELQEAQR